MKTMLFIIAFGSFLGGCQKKSETPAPSQQAQSVDNEMVHYTEALHDDVRRARDAAEKANQAIAAEQQNIKEYNEKTHD